MQHTKAYLLCITDQSGITFTSRGRVTANEEDGYVMVCLRRMGTKDQLGLNETVYIQAQEVEAGLGDS